MNGDARQLNEVEGCDAPDSPISNGSFGGEGRLLVMVSLAQTPAQPPRVPSRPSQATCNRQGQEGLKATAAAHKGQEKYGKESYKSHRKDRMKKRGGCKDVVSNNISDTSCCR